MSRQSGPYKLGQILERMLSTDKDLRYMAVSDLMTETEKGEIVLDEDGEKKVVRHLLKLLEDKSSEVQNIVIRCIGHLTPRFGNRDNLLFLVTSLLEMVPTKNGEIYCTAMKTAVTQLNPTKGGESINTAVKEIYPRLVNLLANSEENLASELMDIASDLLLRYGTKLISHHETSLNTISSWVLKGRSMIRKRAAQALGSLTASCSNELFKKAVENLLEWLNSNPPDQARLRNYVMAANYVCRSRGSQFALYLGDILPKLKRICSESEDEDNREAVLLTLDTFLYFCAGNIADYQGDIQKILLQYLSHDPNYCGGDDDEEMESQDSGAEWEEDEDNQYSDTDDDLSWKVRRSCAKALATEVRYLDNSGKKLLSWMTVVAPKLIERFKDREDHVIIEIVRALKEMIIQAYRFLPEQGSQNVDVFGDIAGEYEATDNQNAVRAQLEELHPRLVRGLSKIIEKKTTIARAVIFELLIELTKTMPNKLTGEFVLSTAKTGFDDKNGGSQIKILTLQFVTAVLKTHEPTVFVEHMPQMTQMLTKAVDDNFYKIVSEGIAVLSRFSSVLQKASEINPNGAAQYINDVYGLLEQLLKKNHGDLEVLHRTITATGVYLGSLAGQGNPKEAQLLLYLTELAEKSVIDQNTTVSALRALKAVAENPRAQPLFAQQLERILGNLANLIEKNGAASKARDTISDVQNSILDLAVTIFETQPIDAGSGNVGRLILGLPSLLKDSDLQVAQKSLLCMIGGLNIGIYDQSFAPALVKLFESHLLSGQTLHVAIQANTALAQEMLKSGKKYEEILDNLTGPVYDNKPLSRQAFRSIAMATADIAAVSGNKEGAMKLANQLVGHLKTANNNERLFSILTIGELGRAFPAVYNDNNLKPEELLFQIFSNQSDDLRPDAAQALGALAAGNPPRFLPFILSQLASASTAQLPLLHAIKEVLNTSKYIETSDLDKIWPVLVAHTDAQEESIRIVVADCIGKLCNDNPNVGLSALQKLLTDSRVNVRYTAVTAFKVIVFDGSNVKNKMLSPYLKSIGDAVSDGDIRVRRIGLIVLNALFKKRTQLMRAHVTQVLPSIYKEAKIKKELIREVEMGPFKHQVDDGVDIRKAAYESLHSVMEKFPAEINMEEFIRNLEDGLKDSNHDIKLQTSLILSRLCSLSPASLLQAIPRFNEQIRSLLTAKPKQNAVRQEIDKVEEMKRAMIRLVKSMEKIPDVDRQLADLLNLIATQTDLKALAEQVEKDDRDTVLMEQ